MHEKSKSDISVNLFHKLTGLDALRKAKLQTDLQKIEENLKSLNLKNNSKKNPLPFIQQNLNENSNQIERSTSAKCKLVESNEARTGKYFVAGEEIETGEVVLIEKAICACLYPKSFGTNCNYCFARLVAPVGCPDCASVAFCSVECRDAGIKSYHKFECKYLDLLIGSGMSILCHIALKIVIQSKSPEEAIVNGKKLISSLCVHSDIRTNEDYFKRALMTTFLLRCLQKSEFFGRRTTEAADPTPKELEIGAIMFSLLQALQFNAHEIYETVCTGDHKFSKTKINYVGVGIYEAGAMFNHECYPSVTRYFNGTHLIYNTIRPHAKGDIIAENYGPIFTKQTIVERQRNLSSRYWFKCECRACTENWPVLDKLSNKCRFKCPTDNCTAAVEYPSDRQKIVKCRKCKNTVSLEIPMKFLRESEDNYHEGAQAMEVSLSNCMLV